MQVRINLKIFFFIIIFLITRQIELYGMLMLFAFFHEIGHLCTGLILGFKPQSLSINPLGLEIKFKVNIKDYNKKFNKGNYLSIKKIIIAASGPLVNFFIALAYYINNSPLVIVEDEFIVYSNILIGLFNLIPIFPLDGGRILKELVHIFKGLEESYLYINVVSNICIVILTIFSSIGILYLKNIAIFFIIMYLWYLVIKENSMYNQRVKIFEILNNHIIESETIKLK